MVYDQETEMGILLNTDIKTLITPSLPCSWYPVLCSTQLRRGRIRAIQLDGNELIVFRGQSGKPGVIQRYCCHFGADLAGARVKGDQVVCPMHGWTFNSCGQRQSHGLNEPVTGALSCAEAFGLIFIYFGEQSPCFDLPRFEYETVAFSKPMVLKLAAEHYLPALNTFDLQHYEKIHGRRFIEPANIDAPSPACLRIAYQAEIVKRGWMDHFLIQLSSSITNIEIECWGGNILKMRNLGTGYGAIIVSTPRARFDSTVYIVVARQTRPKQTALMQYIEMNIARALVKQFLKPDFMILNGMRPDQGWMLDATDHGLVRFLDYFQQLPRWTGFKTRQRDLTSFERTAR
jgi:nitrite reductase/ring-hydroxylating ferredoxin subunit